MTDPKYFVVREVGSDDRKPFAVVEHGEGYDGKWKRKCLWVHRWHETSDAARAQAHSLLYPDDDA